MTTRKLNLKDMLHRPALNDAYEHDVDIQDLLAQDRQIGLIWTTDDVLARRPDLTLEQAWNVLREVERQHDATVGVNWDTLEAVAQDLFGERNSGRIDRCERALSAYGDDIAESNLVDLLTDAMHWCGANGHNFDDKLSMARGQHASEDSDREV